MAQDWMMGRSVRGDSLRIWYEYMQDGRNKDGGEPIRLNKYLSDAGYCSRREADRLLEAGRVSVDGRIAVMGQKVFPGQRVAVDKKEITPEREKILLAMNKPPGVVCTTDRRWGDTTVYDILDYPKRVFSIGRLDKDSEGLLLLTNNGDILNKIMRAGNYHEKEYLVTVNREIHQDFLEKLSRGVYLKELDVTTRPCQVFLAGKNRFRIILTQGLNRQIRRMCAALGYQVTKLVRVRVMNIELGDLKPGEYRPVSRSEYARLAGLLRGSENPGTDRDENRRLRNPEVGGIENRRLRNPEAVGMENRRLKNVGTGGTAGRSMEKARESRPVKKGKRT